MTTPVEMQDRIHEVAEYLVQGNTRRDIVEYCAKHWSVSANTADRYIKRARQYYRREAKRSIGEMYEWSVAARLDLYRNAREAQDNRTALSVLQDLAKLTHLYDSRQEMPSFDLSTEQGVLSMLGSVMAGMASGATDRKLLNTVVIVANVALKALAQQARLAGDEEEYETAESARKALADCDIVELHERINRATQ